MPIFAYGCYSCKHQFETLEPYEPAEPTKCPACSSADCQRDPFNKKAPAGKVNGASAANNYGLKPGGMPSKGRR